MKRKFEVRVNKKLCKKCGICVFMCPKGVFSLFDELKVEAERCNGCRRCEVYCPDFAIEIEAVEQVGKETREETRGEIRGVKHAERAVAGE